MNQKIGMIGVGIMGSAMSANLLKAGFEVIGYDVAPQQLDVLVRTGGSRADSCREVAEQADVVITSLPSGEALQQVVNAKEGLAAAKTKDLIIIETSTLTLEDKQAAHDALSAAGATMLDCPLSGTGAQAVNKDLVVYASGDRQACENCDSIFNGFSRANYYIGEFGAGSRMKFVANLLVAIHNVASAEAFVLGAKAGLDPELIYRVISDGAGTSRMFEVRGLVSMTVRSLFLAAASPSLALTTCCKASPLGSEVMTTSACSATSRQESARLPPARTKVSSCCGATS